MVGAGRRLGGWFRRWRGVPARAERLDALLHHVARKVDALPPRVGPHDLERVGRSLESGLDELRSRHDDLAGRLAQQSQVHDLEELARRSRHDQRVLYEATLAPARDAEAAALVAAHRFEGVRRPGLSVLTITWNHAGWLPDALRSAAEVLDSLGGRAGVHLVLDDGSSDETGTVLEAVADDPRVLVVRSPRNLNLARARNVLLAACPTEHAVVLDADNVLLPAGVIDVLDVAEQLRPTIAWGQVAATDDLGTHWDAFGYAPAWETLVNGLCFDSMAVVDVAAVELLGGYSTDPQLGGVVDDLELLLRTLRRGQLVAYVPTVVGRYRLAPLRHSALAADHRSSLDRVQRLYLYDDPDPDEAAVVAASPSAGVLWAWPAARRLLGDRAATEWADDGAPVAAAVPSGRPRVLVVGPGGVDNLGDDAITWAVVDRLRSGLDGVEVELVTDREAPPQVPGRNAVPVRWNGTLHELWWGLDAPLLAQAASSLGVDLGRLAPPEHDPSPAAVLDHDLVVFAGGGNLAAPFAAGVTVPRLAVAACAAALGIPVVWSGQGVGPLDPDDLQLLRRVLAGADAVGCRDELSAELLAGPGPDPVDAAVVVDDALDLPPADQRPEAPAPPYAVLHLRNAPYVQGSLVDVARAVDVQARAAGLDVVLLAVNGNTPGEVETAASVLAELAADGAPRPWTLVDASGDPSRAAGLLDGAEWVVSHSYHVALWALRAGTPAVLVGGVDYYRRKALGLGRTFGLGDEVLLDPTATAEDLERQLAQVAAGCTQPDVDDDWLVDHVRRLLDARR